MDANHKSDGKGRTIKMHRIVVDDWKFAGESGGVLFTLAGGGGRIYLAFNQYELDSFQESVVACELFVGTGLKPISCVAYGIGGTTQRGETCVPEEIVSFHNAPKDWSEKEVLLVRNGLTGIASDSDWYRVRMSEDDKVAHDSEYSDPVTGLKELAICSLACSDVKDHHYYVRLREEWRFAPGKSPYTRRSYHFFGEQAE